MERNAYLKTVLETLLTDYDETEQNEFALDLFKELKKLRAERATELRESSIELNKKNLELTTLLYNTLR